MLLGEFGKLYSEKKSEIQEIFERNIDIMEIMLMPPDKLSKAVSGYLRFSIEGLRKIEATLKDEDELVRYIGNPLLKGVEHSLIMTAGSICRELSSLDVIKKCVDTTPSDASYWALGKFGSRERKYIMSIDQLENQARKVAERLSRVKGKEILRSAIYALAEMCDRRESRDRVSKETGDFVLNELDKIIDRTPAILKICDVCRTVIKGEKLSEEQNKVLLDLRVLL